MKDSSPQNSDALKETIAEIVRKALRPGKEIPGENEDLLESGALDSMGWVGVLESLAQVAGTPELIDPAENGKPRSIPALAAAVETARRSQPKPILSSEPTPANGVEEAVGIVGWGIAAGSARVDAAELDREYALAPGTLRDRAGIESVVRAAEGEDELNLALAASQRALQRAAVGAPEIDWVLASSETHTGFPSLGAQLHCGLLARESCGVLDVGGACVGLLNAFAVANALLIAGMARRVLIATAEKHSRHLAPGCVAGEFGGLFGDGASAFVLTRLAPNGGDPAFRFRRIAFGCAAMSSSALAVGLRPDGHVTLEFNGGALARAALARMERIIRELEAKTGLRREQAGSFATHQPNPRMVEMLARQAGIPLEKFPLVSRTFGNLGSSTCGVALCLALEEQTKVPAAARGPIFLAAVGPGMLWGGGVLL